MTPFSFCGLIDMIIAETNKLSFLYTHLLFPVGYTRHLSKYAIFTETYVCSTVVHRRT